MKKLLVLLVFATTIVNAQYTIKGSMNPPDKNNWVILYKIEGTKQRFIGNTHTKIDTIKVNGKQIAVASFNFTLPKEAKSGMYRITYRQDNTGFANFLFNKEDVEFSFSPNFPEQSIVFTKSKENILFNDFLQANALTQNKVDSLQIVYLRDSSEIIKKMYPKALKKVTDVYTIYEDKSKGMLASHFIKAMQRDNAPDVTSNPQKYFSHILDTFFYNIDFNDTVLYNSSFLIDRITDYVFYLNYSREKELQQKLFKEAIATIMEKITTSKFKKEATEFLISQFTKMQNAEIVDSLFADYYNQLPLAFQDAEFRSKTLGKLKAAIGRIAPDFSWKEEGKTKRLSTLKESENYLLVFWSTSCSHCVKEIPKLYQFMQTQPNTKVIAYALEKEDFEWNEFTKQLYGWHNVIGLNPNDKWENELVTETYQVHATPSYFVLDNTKKIVAKPNELKNIKEYFAIKNLSKKKKVEALPKNKK